MFFDEQTNTLEFHDDDQCNTCVNLRSGIACPLVEALMTGIAELTCDVGIKNCGFYREYEPHLKVVKDAQANNAQPEAGATESYCANKLIAFKSKQPSAADNRE